MTIADLFPLLPILLISAVVVLNLFAIAFYRNHFLTAVLTSAGLLGACVSTVAVYSFAPRQVTRLIIIDGYSIFYMALIFGAGFVVTLLSYRYLELLEENQEEYYVLLLLGDSRFRCHSCEQPFCFFFPGPGDPQCFAVCAHCLQPQWSFGDRGGHQVSGVGRYI